MGFQKLKMNQGTPPKAAEPTPVQKEPEVLKVEPEPVAVQARVMPAQPAFQAPTPAGQKNAIAFFDEHAGGGINAAALMAITDGSDSFVGLLFPILQLTGGASGGTFVPIKAVPQEVADQMPQGKKPIECVFMGYRTELASWPVGYDNKGDSDSKPAWNVAVPCNAPDDSKLIRGACSKYQYTPRDMKSKWDHAISGIGHIRPVMQLLVYLPSVNDLIVVQTPSHFLSWQKTMENLKKMVDPKTGLLNQTPCTLRAISESKVINGNDVTQHHIEFQPALSGAGAEWWKAYSTWRAAAKQDPEIVNKVNEWLNAADKPMSDELRVVLTKATTH